MQYVYPCDFTPDEEEGDGFVVTFPDVRGGTTGGKTFKESIILAEDCLVVMLGAYIDCHEELPTPGPWAKGQELITVQPLIAAQLDLYTAMREQGITTADLAQRLNLREAEVKKLLILDYRTSIGKVVEALEAVGCKPAVAIRSLKSAPFPFALTGCSRLKRFISNPDRIDGQQPKEPTK